MLLLSTLKLKATNMGKRLPSASVLPQVRAAVKRRQLPESDSGVTAVGDCLDDLHAVFHERTRGSRLDVLKPAQRTFAAMDGFLLGMNDRNLIIGVAVKRPGLLAPAIAAAEQLRCGELTKLLFSAQKQMPPPEHSRSRASRQSWYESDAGARAAKRLHNIWWKLFQMEEQIWIALLSWAIKHESDFFRPSRSASKTVEAVRRPVVKAKPPLSAARKKKLRAAIDAGDADALLAFAEDLGQALQRESEQVEPRRMSEARRNAHAILSLQMAVISDGLKVGVLLNERELIPAGDRFAREMGLSALQCDFAELLKQMRDQPPGVRLASLERRLERHLFDAIQDALPRYVLSHPRSFFAPAKR